MSQTDLLQRPVTEVQTGGQAAGNLGDERPLLEIDVVSDVVCPWCYIGKRQLDAALARRRAAHPDRREPRVRWRPYQLNPDMPAEGVAREEHYRRKFGSAAPAMVERVRSTALGIGLELEFEKIERQPNTLAAHALIELAGEGDLQTTMVETLFRAFFVEGRDLSDPACLLELATAVGMQKELAEAALDREGSVQRLVAAGEAELREFGVNGVPLFIIGRDDTGRVAISGAQGIDALLETMNRFD